MDCAVASPSDRFSIKRKLLQRTFEKRCRMLSSICTSGCSISLSNSIVLAWKSRAWTDILRDALGKSISLHRLRGRRASKITHQPYPDRFDLALRRVTCVLLGLPADLSS